MDSVVHVTAVVHVLRSDWESLNITKKHLYLHSFSH